MNRSTSDINVLSSVNVHFPCVSCPSIWPQYVKDRIHSTYMYFAGSVGMTALSAVAVSRTPALMGVMMRGSWLVIHILLFLQDLTSQDSLFLKGRFS